MTTRKPQLPPIPRDASASWKSFLKAVKEQIEVGDGRRGNELDKYLTMRHLISAGLARQLKDGSLIADVSGTNVTINNTTSSPGYTTTPPETPTNVEAFGGYSTIFVSWDIPQENDPNFVYGYSEVWRSQTDNLGTAVLLGTSPASFYLDEVGSNSVVYYYWVRFVSKWSDSDLFIASPYNAVAGTSARTALDPEYVVDLLNGRISRTQLNTNLNTAIDLTGENKVAIENEVTTRQSLTDDLLYANWSVKTTLESNGIRYVSGFGLSHEIIDDLPVSTFIVKADQFAVGSPGVDSFALSIGSVQGITTVGISSANIIDLSVKNAAIDTMSAEKLFAASGTIAEAILGDAHITNAMIGQEIKSYGWDTGSATRWKIDKSGYAEFLNIKARGDIEATSIKADSANIVDTIHLRGQAVTFSVSATSHFFNEGISRFIRSAAAGGPDRDTFDVYDISINATGNATTDGSYVPIFVMFSFKYMFGFNTPSSANRTLVVFAKVIRRALGVDTDMTELIPVCVWDRSNPQFFNEYEREFYGGKWVSNATATLPVDPGLVTFCPYNQTIAARDVSPPTGSVQYVLQFQYYAEEYTASIRDYTSNRFAYAIENKK